MVAAKAHYLALRSEPSAARRDIAHAEIQWQAFESRLAARMGEIEELDRDVTA